MAAALSASAMALAELDSAADTPAYANTLLIAARQLYDFADSYRGGYSDYVTNAQSFYKQVVVGLRRRDVAGRGMALKGET